MIHGRRALTLLEMIVVGVVMMTLVTTIASFSSYLPRWFSRAGRRLDMVRESQIARDMILKDLATARGCRCVSVSQLEITGPAGSPDTLYFLRNRSGSPGVVDLVRSQDGGFTAMTVGINVESLTCTDQAAYDGVDLCLTWKYPGGRRRAQLQFRVPEERTAALAIADLSRDGKADVVEVNTLAAEVRVRRGDGLGALAAPVARALARKPRGVAVGDWDRDGDLDVAAITDRDIQLLANDGAGNLAAPTVITPAFRPYAVVSADFDRDGRADLVVSTGAGREVAFYAGDGTGGFAAPVITAVGAEARRLAVIDHDRDGVPDVLVGHPTDASATFSRLRGLGTGSFAAPVTHGSTGGATDLAVVDLDRDGRDDVVVAQRHQDRLALFHANGSNSFDAPSFTTSVSPTALAVLQYDADAITDVAVASRVPGQPSSVQVYAGNGTSGLTVSPAPPAIAAGTDAVGLAAGDLKRDGRDDWAAAYLTTPGVAVGLATAAPLNGRFGATTFTEDPDNNTWSVAVGDLNRDGYEEFVVSRRGTNRIQRYRNDDGAGFTSLGTETASSRPYTVRLAQVHRTGMLDIACADLNGDVVRTFRGLGTGDFQNGINTTVAEPQGLALGDFDRDGILDAAVARRSTVSPSVRIYKGDGAGRFTAVGTARTVGSNPYDVAAADFNRDGKLDVVTANQVGNNVSVLLGDGAGALGTATNFTCGAGSTGPRQVVTGDFNRDGIPDIATANFGTNTVGLLLGTGTGSFSAATTTGNIVAAGVGRGVSALEAADLNRDGILDLAVVGWATTDGNECLRSLLNDGTGTFTLTTAVALSSGGEPSDLALFDYNRDGKLDAVVVHDAATAADVRVCPGQ